MGSARVARQEAPGTQVLARWIVGALVFATFFDLFVQYPIAAPYASALGASPALVGLIVATYSITNLLGNVAAGFGLDRLGRIPLIVAGTVGTAVVLVLYVLVQTPGQLLLLRALHGLTVAALAPGAFALAGDLAAPEERARVMGQNGAIIALAAIVAPAFAGVMQQRAGFAPVFLIDAALLATVGFLVFFVRGVTPGRRGVEATGSQERGTLVALVPALLGPYLAVLAFTTGLGTLVTALPDRLQTLGITPAIRGAAFSTYGIVAALVMVSPLAVRMARRSWRISVTLGLFLVALGLAVASALGATEQAVVERSTLIGAALFGLGFGFLFPALTAEVARRAEREQRGRAFGLFYALYSLGVIVGSLLAGAVGEFAGVAGGWPLVAGALVSGTCAVVLLVARRERRAVGE